MSIKTNKRQFMINTIAITLVLLLTAFICLQFIKPDKTVAAAGNQIEIRVNKVTTVSIYVFGEGVELVSSTSNHDTYTADVGTNVRLQAINETRIFTSWVITKQDTNALGSLPLEDSEGAAINFESSIINFNVEADTPYLDVTVNRRNATADDYGKYMMDRFVIINETELIALQDILAGSYKNEDFAIFFKDPDTYDTTVEKDEKRIDLQQGYFLIANNFTVFNNRFVGIGTSSMPFEGIMCGDNGINSKLFITINAQEKAGISSYGLFGYLGRRAVVRNLGLSVSIGITKQTVNTTDNIIYAGGLAGVMNKSTLIDVEVATSIGIDSISAEKIYAGGVAGVCTSGTGIDSISDVVYQGTNSKWSITSSKENSEIHAGLVAGSAKDTYIKEVDIIVTDQLVDLKNDFNANNYSFSKLYLGNLFGSYYALNTSETIDDIMVMGNSGESLRAMTTNGDASIGGLIGYVETNPTASLNVGRVYLRALGSNNEYQSSTIATDSVGNVYVGGLFGFINGNNVNALPEFRERLEKISVDITTANYLIEGEYQISAIQNGTSKATTNGKAIAGGLVGKGLFNLNGDDSDHASELAIASPTSSLVIEAIQSKLTSTNGQLNDKEHACAGLIYGSVGDERVDINNINVYSNNTTVQTIREIGTKAIGDLHTGGFISYATSQSAFSNINLYLNDCKILAESLSYEGKNEGTDTNSAFCGGFAGELLGNSSLTNFVFGGYNIETFVTDTLDKVLIGTTSYIESIQNTIPGGGDYKGENYIGGVVGRIQHVTLTNCKFIGSASNKDFIRMSGHESPDSAFCGGIVGLIRTATNGVPSNIIDCEVINTEVTGSATNVGNYNNPDIYVGGIVGAAYIHATNSTIAITRCNLKQTNVYALGNEKIASYAGGIIGGATWESTININDCYVTDSSVKANMAVTVNNPGDLEASAGGIIGLKGNATNTVINHCVVIDTEIAAEVDSNNTALKAYAAGISGFTENDTKTTIENCYSNANVSATHNNTSGTANAYGIAYLANLTTSSKAVETIITATSYKNFTYGKYTFEVINTQTGTYRIRNNDRTGNNVYVRITSTGTVSDNNSSTRATTFTMQETGTLYGSSRYVTFNGNNISSTRTGGYSFYTGNGAPGKENILVTETKPGTQSVQCNNTYYIKRNVKNAANDIGTALGAGPFEIPLSKNDNMIKTNPYMLYDYLYGFDGSSQKLYIEIIGDNNGFSTNKAVDEILNITAMTENSMVLAHVWINAKELGGSVDSLGNIITPSHDIVIIDDEFIDGKTHSAKDGWFILDYVLLYTGDLGQINSDIIHDANGNPIIDITYTDGTSKYYYQYDENAEEGKQHYIENENNDTDRIYNNYIEHPIVNHNETGKKIKEFTFKVYDEMLYLDANFEIYHFGATYKLSFVRKDAEGNEIIIDDSEFRELYGDIKLSLLAKHSSFKEENGVVTYYDRYNLTYKPNENIENDTTFYIILVGGNDLNSTDTVFKVNLIANKLKLVGVTYADYTPPLNYFETNIGTNINPYKLYVESITKFVPIFTKSNDLVEGRKYVLEEYIEKCNYELIGNGFSIKTNGELTASSNANQSGTLTITLKKPNGEDETYTVYFTSVDDKRVTYSSVGSDIDGLTHASSMVDFYFEQTVRSNYGGVPKKFTITIGEVTYDLKNDPKAVAGIEIYELDKSGNIITSGISEYNEDALGYAIKVSKNLLNGNTINVDIEYPIVYTITFDLQSENFKPNYDKGFVKTFKIVGGTKFNEYFTQEKITEIQSWIRGSEVFGFVFIGFYLVNDANSIGSYGISFEKLVGSDYVVNSSNTFYGRWSYLIELVEAPGTYIKTGFNASFMQGYKEDDFNREIQIPINANQGYVFRIDKDSEYIGEVDVEAYVVTEVDGNKIMTPVYIEYYQGNKNLYYIAPEKITGYLVIMTNVGNSEVIIGEHTTSVTENITPEDGIFTFKYVVNHYNKGGNKSYIYSIYDELGNPIDYSTLNKEFVLDFYKQSDHSDLKLPDFTEIRVYYNCYINGELVPERSLIGTYITYNDDRVYLSEFKFLDLETNFTYINRTFGEALGTNEQVTEVLYFTITPPNGYSEKVKHEMANYVIECGYCVGKAANHETIEYLNGVRTNAILANPNDLNSVITIEVNKETSRQDKVFHVTPSRQTSLEELDEWYRFTDDPTYSVYDIILSDTQKLPDFNYISLYDFGRNSILDSTIMSFPIQELRLTLGYRLGDVRIYGKTSELDDWELVDTITVTSAVYQEYVVDFKVDDEYPYYAYRVDNISTNEIRVSKIDVLSATNGVLYEGSVTHLVEKDSGENIYFYSLVNQIVGDSRHNGKKFILSIQLKTAGTESDIITNISGDIYLNIRDIGLGIEHYVYLNDYKGKGIAYINLSEIIRILNVKTIDFDIVIPDGTEIYEVALLEATNEFKPSQGEVRFNYNNLHIHDYIDGKCSCGKEYVGSLDSGNVAIYYDLSGGTWTSNAPTDKYGDLYESIVVKDSIVTLPIPVKDGYTFLGWYEIGQKVESEFTARNCLLVARWEKN